MQGGDFFDWLVQVFYRWKSTSHYLKKKKKKKGAVNAEKAFAT